MSKHILGFWIDHCFLSILLCQHQFSIYIIKFQILIVEIFAWLDHLSQPHFEGVLRSPLTLLKMGLGSPLGFAKIQSMIARVKTPCIETFFIPLKRSWSVDVQNGLAWTIWTSAAQVMVERRAGSQIGSLTPDH